MPYASPDTWMWTMRSLLMAPAIRSLRVGVSFLPQSQQKAWFPVLADPRQLNLVHFELSCGLERSRSDYNDQCLAKVRRTNRTYIGRRGGFCDLFVPVRYAGEQKGVLVCGPIVTRRPTAATLLAEWRALTGTAPDPDDETFVKYVRSVLDSHVFEGPAMSLLARYIEDFAENMSGETPAGPVLSTVAHDWNALRRYVAEARRWDVAAELVDPERNLAWTGASSRVRLSLEGIDRSPNHVAVVVPTGRASGGDGIPAMLRIDRLQRSCAAFAARLRDTLAGRAAEGAFFLLHVDAARPDKVRAHLSDFMRRLRRDLRAELNLEIAYGLSSRCRHRGELPERYDEALRTVFAKGGSATSLHLYDDDGGGARSRDASYLAVCALRDDFELGHRNAGVAAERVAREATRASEGNVGALRAQLLFALYELLAIAERRGVVDRRTASNMRATFAERLRRRHTIADVASLFPVLVREVVHVSERPRSRGIKVRLDRARRWVEEAGPMTPVDLDHVAREVGLSPSQFSRRFKEVFGTAFKHFIVSTRIERSKVLLRSTTLGAAQVSAEVGWSSPSYFHQAFRRVTGMTPMTYRHAVRQAPTPIREGGGSEKKMARSVS